MQRKPRSDPNRLTGQPPAEAAFTAELAAYQDRNGIPDPAFVEELGVSLSLWRKTRSGRLPLDRKLLVAGGDYVPNRLYQAADISITERMRSALRLKSGSSEAA